MHPKMFLHGGNFMLLFFILYITYVNGQEAAPEAAPIALPPVTSPGVAPPPPVTSPAVTQPLVTTARVTQSLVTTTKKKPSYRKPSYGGGSNYGKNNNGNNKYGYNDKYQEANDGDDDDNYVITGQNGIDPRPYGQDYADDGPVRDNQKSMSGALNVWIRSADDWESENNKKYSGGSGNKYSGNKYNKKGNNKGKNNKDDDYNNDDGYKKDGYRKKRSYSKVSFPVRQFPNYRRFPIERFPPLISIFPWLPIFFDKITYQTFIFSPTGGIYILPPLINFYGQRFAVAQLIKWGYASLVSSGVPPPPGVNVAPLVQPVPVGGGPVVAGVAGVAGGPAGGPAPAFDSKKNQFVGGVKTEFSSFRPRYSQTLDEGDDRSYQSRGNSQSRDNYGSDSNYGGTGKQQVYAQGGPQKKGGGYNY